MTIPYGFRAESMRTPKASRAGALHSHTTPRHASDKEPCGSHSRFSSEPIPLTRTSPSSDAAMRQAATGGGR